MSIDQVGRRAWWSATVATSVLIGFAGILIIRQMPPWRFVLATGPPDSAYDEAGKRYREILAKDGVRVELRQTAGAVENLALLDNPESGVSAGFVQAGTTSAAASADLVSLGAMFEEPLWFFCRCEPGKLSFKELAGQAMSIGSEGSATRARALQILALNEIDPDRLKLVDLPPDAAAQRILDGSIGAMAILSSWESPVVRRLLASPDVSLVDVPRADAYLALLPYLDKIVIPMGVGNLALNRPDHDTTIVGSKASLAVRKSFHPALQYLLLQAAHQADSGPRAFVPSGTFPAAISVDLPLSPDARSFYKSGPSLLRRRLPFWLSELVGRLAFVLLPVLGVLYPLWTLAPRLYDWWMTRRITHYYEDLTVIEREFYGASERVQRPDLLERIDRLDRLVANLHVPALYSAKKYQLKSHVDLVARLVRTGSPHSVPVDRRPS